MAERKLKISNPVQCSSYSQARRLVDRASALLEPHGDRDSDNRESREEQAVECLKQSIAWLESRADKQPRVSALLVDALDLLLESCPSSLVPAAGIYARRAAEIRVLTLDLQNGGVEEAGSYLLKCDPEQLTLFASFLAGISINHDDEKLPLARLRMKIAWLFLEKNEYSACAELCDAAVPVLAQKLAGLDVEVGQAHHCHAVARANLKQYAKALDSARLAAGILTAAGGKHLPSVTSLLAGLSLMLGVPVPALGQQKDQRLMETVPIMPTWHE